MTYEGVGGRRNRKLPIHTVVKADQVLLGRAVGSQTYVDRHLLVIWQTQVLHLRDVASSLHVRSVTTSTKDHSDLGVRVNVVGCDQGTGGVVDESGELDGNVLLHQAASASCPPLTS